MKKVASQMPSSRLARLLLKAGAPRKAPSSAVYSVALPVERPGAVSCVIMRSRHSAQRRLEASASKSSIQRFVITEKAPTRAFSWLKGATTAFTFKTLLRHYAKQAFTPQSLNVKLRRLS